MTSTTIPCSLSLITAINNAVKQLLPTFQKLIPNDTLSLDSVNITIGGSWASPYFKLTNVKGLAGLEVADIRLDGTQCLMVDNTLTVGVVVDCKSSAPVTLGFRFSPGLGLPWSQSTTVSGASLTTNIRVTVRADSPGHYSLQSVEFVRLDFSLGDFEPPELFYDLPVFGSMYVFLRKPFLDYFNQSSHVFASVLNKTIIQVLPTIQAVFDEQQEKLIQQYNIKFE